MVKAICNFCTKFVETYRCKIIGMNGDFYACRKCIRTLPIQLIPMEEYNETEAEGEQEVEES